MKEKIELRITELQAEYEKGEERLELLEREAAGIKSSMLRISGAIQALSELIGEPGDRAENVQVIENDAE